MFYTLAQVYRNTTNKEGQPNVDKRGKSYVRYTLEFSGGTRVSYLDYERNVLCEQWKAGDQIEGIITENITDGRKYTNFTPSWAQRKTPQQSVSARPADDQGLINEIATLKKRLDVVEAFIVTLQKQTREHQELEMPAVFKRY